MTEPPALEALAQRYGILPEYHDIWGRPHRTTGDTARALLQAMGVLAEGENAAAALARDEETRWRRFVPPVTVLRSGEAPRIALHLPAARAGGRIVWQLALENGSRIEGGAEAGALPVEAEAKVAGARFLRLALALPALDTPGYHRLRVALGEQQAELALIVAPRQCYAPAALAGRGRVWGPAVQLYGLRSRRNWGMGDFSDLTLLIEHAARAGAAIVGVNPLHALFPDRPEEASPYGPSDRRFLNVLYLDPEAIEEFAHSEVARALVAEPEFQARLRALRGTELVDYEAVAALKFPVLRELYRTFLAAQAAQETPRGRAFRAWREAQGEALQRHAVYDALQADFRARDPALWGWPVWPLPYRHPESPEVAAFAADRGEEVGFHAWLQWQADAQLGAVGARSWQLGLGVGLYQDLAVGAAPGGAETWGGDGLYADGASTGAPPDDFNLHGQDWGLPPWVPHRLVQAAYAPFIGILRANMRHAGALRIDHVMGLARLFWVPRGQGAAAGAYVSYPFADLLGILALESQRNRCLVIGEDLGTVPDAVREALAPLGVLSYRPLWFQRDGAGDFLLPAHYPPQALVTVSTHDLPTLPGYWRGHDLDLRARLELFPSPEQHAAQVVGRAQDRARLLLALEREGLLAEGERPDPIAFPEMTDALTRAVHLYLARTPSRVLMVQPEDVFGAVEQVNLPGSLAHQHPNWRRKLPMDLEDWPEDPRLQALVAVLASERRAAAPAAAPGRAASRIPWATYRLQFHRGFTLAQAEAAVPYLAALGVSHVYASPLLKARAGSSHGYDIIDHNELNPEIGSAEDFRRFCDGLRRHGLALMLDVVPNHMGVLGGDNQWWLDVLENGPASAYAEFFDIDWSPIKPELKGKVLLPVLGDHYGRVLERGELALCFDAQRGAFDLTYYEHRFPVDPREYPRILGRGVERLAARLGEGHGEALALHSLIAAFGHLPPRDAREPSAAEERARDKEIHKRQLAALAAASPDVALYIAENVAAFNGRPGAAESFDALHELIQAQAYRLAFWRVASDEINYRRFFDINDLAALRMEREEVFEATHRLVFEWLGRGDADALRIDHPDGLLDPGQYFRRLQARFAELCAPPVPPAAPPERALYLVVEKILAEHERLPQDWPVHGSTGYRFTNVLNGLFVDTAAAERMTRIYRQFTGAETDFDELLYGAKRLIIRTALSSELNVLTNQLARIALANRSTCDYTLNSLRDALTEVVACFPVYRTYVTAAGPSEQDLRYIDWAVARAKKRSLNADLSAFDFLKSVLTTEAAPADGEQRERVCAFAMKFQQYTAPVMAKGMEDTSFYRYHRLVSLNEVGGDPRTFGFSLAAFHGASQDRARNWPHTLLASSTHDAKRSEDVRARINLLSEMAAAWKLRVQRWSRLNRSKKTGLGDLAAPSPNDEYLLYQTLLGMWPLETPDLENLRERLERYMLKAAREAKEHTSWINPDADYEAALSRFVTALFANPEKNLFLADFTAAQRSIARLGMFNSLSQTLVKLTSPGVPDLYQGTEVWDFSLVDPDNRRPVDFARRAACLQDLEGVQGPQLLESMEDGRAKLLVVARALALRRAREAAFVGGDYLPLLAEGSRAQHVCAFARSDGGWAAVTVVPRLLATLCGQGAPAPLGEAVWQDTLLPLPGEWDAWENVLTGERLAAERRDERRGLALATVLAQFPVALLIPAGGPGL